MLTKQAREKIAERAKKSIDSGGVCGPYQVLTNDPVPQYTNITVDNIKMCSVILDLCEHTSDMMELPRDKDDKVIHIGDTVWHNGEKETVKAIEIRDSGARIHFVVPLGCESWSSPELITHAEPISEYERIAQEIEEIAAGNSGTVIADDLRLVAEEIRELGESDD